MATADPPVATDPQSVLRSRGYLVLVGLGALLGVPVSAAAFGFLELVRLMNEGLYDHLPGALGFHGEPAWWPVPVVGVSGVLVALAVRHLPGGGGHDPADGFTAAATRPISVPGVVLAALATLGFGAVLGPEAPLIAVGSALGMLAVRLARKDAPPTAQLVVASAGSFAALGTILGSPLVAALFMLEAVGLGGPALSLVILPGLLAAGVGSLVFIGLGTWTGLGTFSLAIPDLPALARPTPAELGWALAVGLAGAAAALVLRRGAVWVRDRTKPRMLVVVPLLGLAVGALAMGFGQATGKPSSDVLFSGQDLIGPLIGSAATWSVGALLLLVACKGLAYALSLGGFRGGPIFPALLLGAAGGIAASHLPGLGLVPAVAMGMGAMTAAMLRLPVVAVALPTILLFSDGIAVAPVVIVAVVVSYLATGWLDPKPAAATPAPAAAVAGGG
ncbi:MAG: chloride channel protein [Acidimicrobiales bacterium]